jgi:hypothetical protein
VTKITAAEILDILKRVEKSGRRETEAREFASVGPAAYQATAAEADAARKKIEQTKKAIFDTKSTLEAFRNSLLDNDKQAARAFTDQQPKVSDLRKQLTTEDDPTQQAELRRQIARESSSARWRKPLGRRCRASSQRFHPSSGFEISLWTNREAGDKSLLTKCGSEREV